MGLSRRLFFLLLVPLLSMGQELPVWENSVHLYNRFTTGKDFQNAVAVVAAKDGSIIVQPHTKPVFKIGNHDYSEILPNVGARGAILKIEHFGETDLLLFYNAVIIKNNGIETPLLNFKELYSVNGYIYSLSKKVYFSVFFEHKNQTVFYSYDGHILEKIITVNFKNYYHLASFGDEIYIVERDMTKNQTLLYDFKTGKLVNIKVYPFYSDYLHFLSKEDVYYQKGKKLFYYKNGKSIQVLKEVSLPYYLSDLCYYNNKSYSLFYNVDEQFNLKQEYCTSLIESVHQNVYSPESASLYLGTGNHFMRMFKYLRKYPRIYNKTNSGQIFSLIQAKDGKIWAGSYDGNISVIDNGKIQESKIHDFRIMNGGLAFKDKVILNAEHRKGILLFKELNRFEKISDTITAYYNYISSDSIFYAGTYRYGIMYKPVKDIENRNIKWKFAGSKEGIKLQNCLTITEDKYGNIWTARASEGIAVYQPEQDKAKTWLINDKKITYGARAMLKDSRNTLWIGTSAGNLVYWNGKHKNDFADNNFIKINHPLLYDSQQSITFIHQWNGWLILGATDKALLFDLNTWYKTGKAIVKYLNPIEASLTSTTEQNAVFTDFRDKTIWFSTSDMLYQWDIANWLKLPEFKAVPKIHISSGRESFVKENNAKLELKPTQNSFNIEVRYQTKDNMPRYISGELVLDGEKSVAKNVGLDHKFHFQNLSSGDYTFHLLVCQQGGTYDTYEFPVTIRKFFWQEWWFWVLVSLFPISFTIYYFNNKREKEKRKKEIIQLNINTLSNQFRPHFMLNALNSLGTDMDDKPHAEKVISRIGENINLMYDYSQNNKFYISFESEWKLVENTIEIHKLIFIKELEVTISRLEIIPYNYKIPLGIIQVCVENALLHGIRHRKIVPYILNINFSSDNKYYLIDIIDNGVGRKNSSNIYGFKRNGTGLKNISALMEIINLAIPDAVKITITDDVHSDMNYPGTKVQIKLLKEINYDKFKI